jgi:hypothetical protein
MSGFRFRRVGWFVLGLLIAAAAFAGAYAIGRTTRGATTVTHTVVLAPPHVLVDRVQTLAPLGSAGRLPALATTTSTPPNTSGQSTNPTTPTSTPVITPH